MTIERVGIVGGGTMGGGIAQSAAQYGFPVVLVDLDQDAARRSRDAIADQLQRAAAKGRMSSKDAAAATARIHPVGDLAALSECDLVIEAVFEDLSQKIELFRRMADVVARDTLIATNTSSFRVDTLASEMPNPARFLGMHYFVPAAINKLVEVVRGEKTAQTTIDAAVIFARATGKEPLVCRDSNGFVVNRFFIPFYNEAVRIFDDGAALPAQIDDVASEILRAAVGPFFVMNLSKPRIALHSCRTLDIFGRFYVPAAGLERQGRADTPFEIPAAPPLSGEERQTVSDRLRAAIFLPALQLLDEGVTTPEGIDLGARLALRWDAPPCASMDALGRASVEQLIAKVIDRFPDTRMPASVARVGALTSSAA